MYNVLSSIDAVTSSQPFLLIVFVILVITKVIILKFLFAKRYIFKFKSPYFLLIGTFIFSIIGDLDWIFEITKTLLIENQPLRIMTFYRRIGWASFIAFYQFLLLFLESLVDSKSLEQLRNKIALSISAIFSTIFIGFAFFHFNCLSALEKHWTEIFIQKMAVFYILFPLTLSSLVMIFHKYTTTKLPKILTKQVYIFLFGVLAPYWIADFIQLFPFIFTSISSWYNPSHSLAGLSNILITLALLYCSRKMLGLRFLNWANRIQSAPTINFTKNLKDILAQLKKVTTIPELVPITHLFFKEAFDLSPDKVIVHVCSNTDLYKKENGERMRTIESTIQYLAKASEAAHEFMQENAIFVYDELEFGRIYEESDETKQIFAFLQDINADIFLPIYEKKTLAAYIVIQKYARRKEFYSGEECDEMLVFAQNLNDALYRLHMVIITSLLEKNKKLEENFHIKLQENEQYKESMRSFLYDPSYKKGIIFYKNRHFTFANQAAKELIPVDPNAIEGHPLCQGLKKVAESVERYRTNNTLHVKDFDGRILVLDGIPNQEYSGIIIIVHYPEITDIVKKQIDKLKDHSDWDYLLCLETTQSGKLINQMIPSSSKTILNVKIKLLKAALSKKATLLRMPENDLLYAVQLIHQISLRDTLHLIELNGPDKTKEFSTLLFGMSSLLTTHETREPLLKKLDGIGTLFIKNIHFLNFAMQEALAEFIRYSFFRIGQTEKCVVSNVRIICSTDRNLSELIAAEKFSPALYEQLNKEPIILPSPAELPDHEFFQLFQGINEQMIEKNKYYKNFLQISEKRKQKLLNKRPKSLHALKEMIQEILVEKSKQNEIDTETSFDITHGKVDPNLVEEAYLGKNTLHYPNRMQKLWHKFNKNQNRIAIFLGVNRSSVHRVLRKFKIID